MMFHGKKLKIDLGSYEGRKEKSSQLVAAINAVGANNVNHTAGVMKPKDYLSRHGKKKYEINIDLD